MRFGSLCWGLYAASNTSGSGHRDFLASASPYRETFKHHPMGGGMLLPRPGNSGSLSNVRQRVRHPTLDDFSRVSFY